MDSIVRNGSDSLCEVGDGSAVIYTAIAFWRYLDAFMTVSDGDMDFFKLHVSYYLDVLFTRPSGITAAYIYTVTAQIVLTILERMKKP